MSNRISQVVTEAILLDTGGTQRHSQVVTEAVLLAADGEQRHSQVVTEAIVCPWGPIRVSRLEAGVFVEGPPTDLRVTNETAQYDRYTASVEHITHLDVNTGVNATPAAVRVSHLYVQVLGGYCDPIAGRIITTPLNDATLRPQFLGHKMIVERTLDPLGTSEASLTWETMEEGYCTRATLVDALTWEFAIGDVDRVEREATLFDGIAVNSAGVMAPALVGDPPIFLGWQHNGIYYEGSLPDLSLPIWEVTEVEAGQWVKVQYVSGPLPVVSGANGIAYVNAMAKPFANTYAGYQDTGFSYIFPDLVVELHHATTGAPIAGAGSIHGIDGQWTPLGPDFTVPMFIMPVMSIVVDWGVSQPAVGTQYRVKVYGTRATALTPFRLVEHPVEIAAAIYDALGIVYDAASVATTKAAMGSYIQLFLRPTEPINALQMLEDWLFGPFGFAYRVVAGVREFYPTRYRDKDTPPATTLTLADLRGEGTPYDLTARGGVGRVVWEEESYQIWVSTAENGDVNERPLDTFLPVKATSTFVQDDANAPPYLGGQTYRYPGAIIPPSQFSKQGVSEEIFYRWGRGTTEIKFPLLADFTDQIGAFVINEVNYSPIPEAGELPITVRPKDYPLRTPRQVLQLVKRSDSVAGPEGVFQIVGPVSVASASPDPDALDVPTLTFAVGLTSPKNTGLVTVTNWIAMQTDPDLRCDFVYGTGGSEPTTWLLFSTLPVISMVAGLALTPAVLPGVHLWVKARLWHTDGRVGAWSAVEDLTLDTLDPPTTLDTTVLDTSARVWLTWVNGEPTEPVVLCYGVGATPSAWVEIAQLAAGTTAYIWMAPAISTLYTVEVYHRQTIIAGSESTHDSEGVTTGGSTVTLDPPTGPVAQVGLGVATLAVLVGDPLATGLVFESAPETGAGTFTTWTTFATVPCTGAVWPAVAALAASVSVVQEASPFDGTRNRYYQVRAYHTAMGCTDSATTTALTVDPWGTSLPPQSISSDPGVYTEGDLLLADSAGQLQPLAIGGAGEVLTADGTTASWEPAGAGGALDDLTDVNAAAPNDLDVLTWDNGNSEWIAAPPAGGITGPDTPPGSPDAMDDEFDGVALDGKWTWRNQGSATATVGGGRLIVQSDQKSTENLRILEQTVTGSWRIRCKLWAAYKYGTNYYRAFFGVLQNSDGRSLSHTLGYVTGNDAWSIEKYTAVGTWSSRPLSYANVDLPRYLEIESNGTTLFFRTSQEGTVFVTQFSEAIATFMSSVDRVIIGVNDMTNLSPAGAVVFEWFRRMA